MVNGYEILVSRNKINRPESHALSKLILLLNNRNYQKSRKIENIDISNLDE